MSFLQRIFKRKPAAGEGGLFADAQQAAPGVSEPRQKVKQSFSFPFGRKNAADKPLKPTKASKPSSMDAAPVELMSDESGQVIVAFGMRWRTLVTTIGRDSAQSMAAKAKGTHYVLRTGCLGYGLLPKHVEGQIFPSAVLAAKSDAGTAIFALRLDKGTYWFALVRNGQPTSSDEVVTGIDDALAVARVRALMAQFESENVTVFSDIRASGISGQRAFSVIDIFDVARSDQDRLIKLPPRGGRVPKPLLYAVFAGASVLVIKEGLERYREYENRIASEANAIIDVAPEIAWAPVVQKFLNTTSKPSATGIVAVRKSLADLPVVWAGWKLTGARCQAGDMGADKVRNWSCQGTFERDRVADTSEQILARVKARFPDYAASFPSINTLVIGWAVSQKAESILLDDLKEPNDITIRVASQLQGFFPALSGRPEFKMVPHELQPPMRQDGKPHPKPPSVPTLFKGDLVLKGPLRTMDAMTQELANIEWLSVGLVFDPKSAPSQKGITTSSMSVELTGRVYGKKGTP